MAVPVASSYVVAAGQPIYAGKHRSGFPRGALLAGVSAGGYFGSNPSLFAAGATLGAVTGSAALQGYVLPAWLAGQPLNQWIAVPNSTVTALVTSSGTASQGILHDYNAVTLKPDDSMVIAFGGGHAGSSDNTVAGLRLSADSPAWEVLCQPTPVGDREQALDGGAFLATQLWWGTSGAEKPNPWHTYNSGQWCDALNRVLWFGMYGPWSYSGNPPDGNRIISFKWSDKTWAQPGSADDLGTTSAVRVTAQDAAGVIYIASGTRVETYTPGVGFATLVDTGSLAWNTYGSMQLDTTRNRLFRFGNAYGTDPSPRLITTAGAVSTPTLTGADVAGLEALGLQDTIGQCYDPINDRYIFPTGSGGSFYAVNASTFAVTLVSPSGVTPANKPNSGAGVYDRIRYVPGLRGVVYLPNANNPACFMRLA